MIKRLSKIDFGELKFPFVAFVMAHPEYWHIKLRDIFKKVT